MDVDRNELKKNIAALIPVYIWSTHIRKVIIDIGLNLFDLGRKVGAQETKDGR